MGRPGNDVLAAYLNLQQCTHLTLQTFLEHTLLNLIGEMARQVFHCKYSELLRPNPTEGNERLRKDPEFTGFVDLFARVKERTHTQRGGRAPRLCWPPSSFSSAMICCRSSGRKAGNAVSSSMTRRTVYRRAFRLICSSATRRP